MFVSRGENASDDGEMKQPAKYLKAAIQFRIPCLLSLFSYSFAGSLSYITFRIEQRACTEYCSTDYNFFFFFFKTHRTAWYHKLVYGKDTEI